MRKALYEDLYKSLRTEALQKLRIEALHEALRTEALHEALHGALYTEALHGSAYDGSAYNGSTTEAPYKSFMRSFV